MLPLRVGWHTSSMHQSDDELATLHTAALHALPFCLALPGHWGCVCAPHRLRGSGGDPLCTVGTHRARAALCYHAGAAAEVSYTRVAARVGDSSEDYPYKGVLDTLANRCFARCGPRYACCRRRSCMNAKLASLLKSGEEGNTKRYPLNVYAVHGYPSWRVSRWGKQRMGSRDNDCLHLRALNPG